MTRLCYFVRTEENLVQELLSMLRFSMDYNYEHTSSLFTIYIFKKWYLPKQSLKATTEDKEKRCNSNKPFPYITEQFPTDT